MRCRPSWRGSLRLLHRFLRASKSCSRTDAEDTNVTPTSAVETPMCREELRGDGAWTGRQLAGTGADYIARLSNTEVAQLVSGLQHFKATGKSLLHLQPADFPLPLLDGRIEELRRQVTEGGGFSILRGMPLGRGISEDDAKMIQWGLTRHLGEPVPQNGRGHLLGHVIAKQVTAAKRRTYESNVAQVYHSDGSDVVSLLCVRQADHGGESTIASSVTIHNVMLRERPDLLERLYRTFYHSRMGEETPGETPFYPCPMYTYLDGYLNCRPGTSYIKDAQRFDDVPRLSDTDLKALEWWKSVPLRRGLPPLQGLQIGVRQARHVIEALSILDIGRTRSAVQVTIKVCIHGTRVERRFAGRLLAHARMVERPIEPL